MAWNTSGGVSGAISGAQMGSTFGPYGTAIGAIAGGAIGGFGNSEGTPGQDAYWSTAPQFQHSEAAQNLGASTAMDTINMVMSGKSPWYVQKEGDLLRSQSQRQLGQKFFGYEGFRGGSQMSQAQRVGASSGIGGKAAAAPVNQALQKYASEEQQINQYIMDLQRTGTQTALDNSLNYINTMRLGPQAQLVGATAGTQGQAWGSQLLGSMSSLTGGMGGATSATT